MAAGARPTSNLALRAQTKTNVIPAEAEIQRGWGDARPSIQDVLASFSFGIRKGAVFARPLQMGLCEQVDVTRIFI